MYIKSTHTQSTTTTPSRAAPSSGAISPPRVNRPIRASSVRVRRARDGRRDETVRERALKIKPHSPSSARAPFFRSTRCAPVDSLWSRTTTSRAGAFVGFANIARARRSSRGAGRSIASIDGDVRATFYAVSTRARTARVVWSRREIRRARAVPSRRGLTTTTRSMNDECGVDPARPRPDPVLRRRERFRLADSGRGGALSVKVSGRMDRIPS